MATESMDAPSPTIPRRRLSSNRACDRCRRRKAKCDWSDSANCSKCHISGERCRFDLPLGRRGPKTRRTGQGTIHQSLPRHNSHTASELQFSESSATAHAAHPVSPPLDTSRLPLTSPTTWDRGFVAGAGPALSPGSSIEGPASIQAVSSVQRWHNLTGALRQRDPSANLEPTINRCFALFFEYLYPLIPLVHEPSLREGLDFFVAQASHVRHAGLEMVGGVRTATYVSGNHSASADILDQATGVKYPELWPDSIFTIITATCAEAAFLLPKDIFPEGEGIADIFLQASRSCLAGYLEADLEYPNANSVAIRYFHSNCLHAAGKPKFSWHIFGEATRLAQVMQLHEEASLDGLLPLEAELRRRVFWIVYVGDKSAAILNNRPITIHKFSFESGITTAYPTGIEGEMATFPGVSDSRAARKSFIAGFEANLRLWQCASDLILEMRLLRNQRDTSVLGHRPPTTDERGRLDSLYVSFMTCLDDLPPYLQANGVVSSGSEENKLLRKQFVIQFANLHVSLHCLRMVIAQKFEDHELFAPGVEHADMQLLRKTEIARDMLRVIREAPFWALQVNGEPCVEKIRLIGASLLAIMHRSDTSPLSVRARNDFNVLLDFLTRLDSKASDALRNGSTWMV